MIRSIMIFCFAVVIDALPESDLYFTDYCTYLNYPSESHRVETTDGYLLTFFRIQAKFTKIT